MGTFVFIFLVVGAVVGLVMGIAKTKRDSKHKKESQFVFNNLKDFKADNYYLSTSSGMSIGFDNQRKKICFMDRMHKPFIYDYSKILQCEVVIDGETILKQSTTGTIGRSVLGGILSGGVGAIIGGTTGAKTQKENISSIDLKVIIIDTVNPIFRINFLNLKTKKGSMIYKMTYPNVEKWHGIISGLIRQGSDEDKSTKSTVNFSSVDELKKLKELLDDGVVTIDEFQNLKGKIINPIVETPIEKIVVSPTSVVEPIQKPKTILTGRWKGHSKQDLDKLFLDGKINYSEFKDAIIQL